MARPTSDTIGLKLRHFNDFIRWAIKQKGETQEELSNYLGVSRSTISYRINGDVDWSLRDALKACEYFDAEIEDAIK